MMSDPLQRIITAQAELEEDELLALVIEEIMNRADPETADSIRSCAITRWFDEETINWLRGEGLHVSEASKAILDALLDYTFVGPHRDQGYTYHEDVRNLLLDKWKQGNPNGFIRLNQQITDYFLQKAERLSGNEKEVYAREAAYQFLSLGHFFGEQTRWEDAIENLGRALTIYRELEDPFGEVAVLEELAMAHEGTGSSYYEKQDWQNAAQEYECALQLYSELEDTLGLQEAILGRLGIIYSKQQMWENAAEVYSQRIQLYRAQDTDDFDSEEERVAAEEERLEDLTLSLIRLAQKHEGDRNWTEAIAVWGRIADISRESGNIDGERRALQDLGGVYERWGLWFESQNELEEAVKCFGQAVQTYRESRSKGEEARLLYVSGNSHGTQGRWHEAEKLFEQALQLYREIGDLDGQVNMLNAIGLAHSHVRQVAYQAGGDNVER